MILYFWISETGWQYIRVCCSRSIVAAGSRYAKLVVLAGVLVLRGFLGVVNLDSMRAILVRGPSRRIVWESGQDIFWHWAGVNLSMSATGKTFCRPELSIWPRKMGRASRRQTEK